MSIPKPAYFFPNRNDICQSTIWVEYFIWLLQDSGHKFTGSLDPNKWFKFFRLFLLGEGHCLAPSERHGRLRSVQPPAGMNVGG